MFRDQPRHWSCILVRVQWLTWLKIYRYKKIYIFVESTTSTIVTASLLLEHFSPRAPKCVHVFVQFSMIYVQLRYF